MHIMKSLVLALMICCFYLEAMAGHSRGNGTCDDDKTHYENMIVNGKRDDAPLIAESKAMRDRAHTYHNYLLCEQYMEEALRMIRKPYPTE